MKIIKHGYIVTKPLQLIVVMAIIHGFDDRVECELIVVDEFCEAKKITERIKKLGEMKWNVRFANTHGEAYATVRTQKYDKLFIDTDVGVRCGLTLMRVKLSCPETMIAVYEEGIGSYRSDLYFGIKKKILSVLGVGVHFGGSKYTEELYLFHPEENRNIASQKLKKIEMSVDDVLVKYRKEFESIFDAERMRETVEKNAVTNRKCIVYLTSWQIDKEVIDKIRCSDGLILVKPHPHIKNISLSNLGQKLIVVSGGMPAEILLSYLASKFDDVCVVHHGSSVCNYIKISNIEYVNAGDYRA